MTSPLCLSHFAESVSPFTTFYRLSCPSWVHRRTSRPDDIRVNHALGAIHEIPKLRFPNGQQSWSSPAHAHFEACRGVSMSDYMV